MPRPAIGIDQRIRGLGEGTMHRSELARAGRTAGGGADQWVPEPDPGADLDQPGRLGRGRDASAPILSRWAARHNRVTSPTGSTAAVSRSRRVSGGSGSSRRMKFQLDAAGERHRVRQSDPAPSSAGVNPRGSSTSASGLPRVSATIRGADPLVHRGPRRSSPTARGHRRRRGLRRPDPGGPRTQARRWAHARRRRGPPAPPRGGAQRTQGHPRRPGRAVAHRRRGRRAAALRPQRRAVPSPRARSEIAQAAPRRDGGRMPSRA